MFENPRRSRQARNFTTNVPKILDLKSSSNRYFPKIVVGCPCPEPIGELTGFYVLTFFYPSSLSSWIQTHSTHPAPKKVTLRTAPIMILFVIANRRALASPKQTSRAIDLSRNAITCHNALCLSPEKFCVSIVFSFSCELKWPQVKLKTMLMQNFGVTNKEHYGMLWYFLEWSIDHFRVASVPKPD